MKRITYLTIVLFVCLTLSVKMVDIEFIEIYIKTLKKFTKIVHSFWTE